MALTRATPPTVPPAIKPMVVVLSPDAPPLLLFVLAFVVLDAPEL